MPLYECSCVACGAADDYSSTVANRHVTPACAACGGKTKLVISAVRGFVQFPAAGGQGYVSPTTGKFIDTKRARTEDLKRSGCRPYEGFESEMKESKRQGAYAEAKQDAVLEDNVRKAYADLPPSKKKVLDAGTP
jgi:predicted nucleic acid-binding Zn ribbon protein